MNAPELPRPNEPERPLAGVWARAVGGSRRLRRGFVALLTVGATFAFVCTLLLHSLDRPWLKSRIQRWVRHAVGLDVDYSSARVDLLNGIELDELTVLSPEALRGDSPELARIRRLSVRWSPRHLLSRSPRLDRLSVDGVALSVVVDEDGKTTFDALGPPAPAEASAPSPSSPREPLSRVAASLLARPLPLAAGDLGLLRLEVVRTHPGQAARRSSVAGVRMAMSTEAPSPGRPANVVLSLGSPDAPLDLELQDAAAAGGASGPRAHAALWAYARLTPDALTAAFDLRVTDQTFAPSVAAQHWIHAEASARFEPAQERTTVSVEKLSAGDGSIAAAATLELPDEGDPVVRKAEGHADGARLLAWLPRALVPVTLERAELDYRVEGLLLGAAPRFEPGGSAKVDAELSRVRVQVASGALGLDRASLSLSAVPLPDGGVSTPGSVHVDQLEASLGGQRVAASKVDAQLVGRRRDDGSVEGRVDLRAGRVDLAGDAALTIVGGHFDVALKGFFLGETSPLASRGDVTVAAEAGVVEASLRGGSAHVEGLGLRAHTVLAGKAPYAVEIDAPMSHLRFVGADGQVLADSPARLQCALRDLVADPARPAASRGSGHVSVDLGDLTASFDATKGVDDVEYRLHAATPSLKVARLWVPKDLLADAPWDRIGVTVDSEGRLSRLASSPAIRHATTVGLDRAAFRGVSAPSTQLRLASEGDGVRHAGTLEVTAQKVAWPGVTPGDDHLTLAFAFDRAAPSFTVSSAATGHADLKLSLAAAVDAVTHAVPYELDVRIAKAGPLQRMVWALPALAGLTIDELCVGFSSRGDVRGVVAGVTKGAVTLEARPSATAYAVGEADLSVDGLKWARGTNALALSGGSWHLALAGDAARRTIESHLTVAGLHVGAGSKAADVSGLDDTASYVVGGDLGDPSLEVRDRLTVRSVSQDFIGGYPMGDVSLALRAERDREGTFHVSQLDLDNKLAGSTLALSGNVEATGLRRRLSLAGTVGQDLGRLAQDPARFVGHGELGAEAHVTSVDLDVFRVRATVKAKDVSLKLKAEALEVAGANGEIPILVSLAFGKDGLEIRPDDSRSVYSMLRFADQHPLLTKSGVISLDTLKTRYATVTDLAGNIAIERNVISLRQFELHVRQGTVTGQLAVTWNGPKSTAELHLRATGVRSSHGEPFDGNMAVVISAADRTIEGRADVLRIGPRHLLDLLDLADGSRKDPGMNRIRSALAFGYPDRLRLSFDHGFANAKLELGGLARMVSISELRGIPMGPIIDSSLASAGDGKDNP